MVTTKRPGKILSSDDFDPWGMVLEGRSNVFEAAELSSLNDLQINTPAVQALGQGLHALQDAFAHRGENMNKHLFNSTIWDIVGSTNGARSITKSALIVYEILHGSFSNVTEGTVLDFGGMTPSQIARVERELDRKGYYIDWQ